MSFTFGAPVLLALACVLGLGGAVLRAEVEQNQIAFAVGVDGSLASSSGGTSSKLSTSSDTYDYDSYQYYDVAAYSYVAESSGLGAAAKGSGNLTVQATYDLNPGAACKSGYVPITSNWQDCKAAAESLGFSGDSVAYVDYSYAFGTDRPQGCFQSDGNGRFHFNTGTGGNFHGADAILCEQVAMVVPSASWKTRVPPPTGFEVFLDPIAPRAPMKLASRRMPLMPPMPPLGPSEEQPPDEFRCDMDRSDCWAGDVLLNPHQMEAAWAAKNLTARGRAMEAIQVANGKVTLWPSNVVKYSWDPNIHPESKKAAIGAMAEWARKTCIKFQEAPAGKGVLWIQSSPVGQGGCYAHLGYSAVFDHKMNLENPGCSTVGVALHELGHVIGLDHEHARPEAVQYVELHLENAEEWWKQWLTPYDKTRGDMSAGIPYDLGSIMHYGPYAGSLKRGELRTISIIKNDTWGNCKVGQRTTLSEGDILTVNKWYGCPGRFCADLNTNCGGWKSKGYCSTTSQYYPYMTTNCADTCDTCRCDDTDEKCKDWADAGYCAHAQYGPYMKAKCRMSCGDCSFEGARNCNDGTPWGRSDGCRVQALGDGTPACENSWFRGHCPKTCDACEGTPYCW